MESGAHTGGYPAFGDYTTTKALIEFMQSKDTLLEMPILLENGETSNVAFEKTEDTTGFTSSEKYPDIAVEDYYKSSIENLMVSVYQFKGADTIPPVIAYMKSYTKAYKVYLGITDNLTGIDEDSINVDTVQFISDNNSLYRDPFYDAEYLEIGIVIAEDIFLEGDEVHVSGVMDLAGNAVEDQVWRYDGSAWTKQ